MFLYTAIEAIVGVVAGILIAVCTKKTDGVIYSKLDMIGRVTNILLLLFYVGFSYFYLFLGVIANPRPPAIKIGRIPLKVFVFTYFLDK